MRDRNSIKDVVFNWVVLLGVYMPMAVGAMLGYLYGMLYILGAI